jgi:ABC-type nitrate/sulfonate/bicarbonate transport system permease component
MHHRDPSVRRMIGIVIGIVIGIMLGIMLGIMIGVESNYNQHVQ